MSDGLATQKAISEGAAVADGAVDRTTKRVKIREEGFGEGDGVAGQSFKDCLLKNGGLRKEFEDTEEEEDVDFDCSGIAIDTTGKIPSISISDEVHEALARKWQFTVVAKIYGRKIGYMALVHRLGVLWNGYAFKIMDVEGECFLIKFKSNEGFIHALTGGPWPMLGSYLVAQPWTRTFCLDNPKIDRMVVWARLPGIPHHLYDKRSLRIIGSVMGEIVKVDYNTAAHHRGKYARIAVVIDLNKPLVGLLRIDGKLIKIEYENIIDLCYLCGMIGHRSEACKTASKGDLTDSTPHEEEGNGKGKCAEEAPVEVAVISKEVEKDGALVHDVDDGKATGKGPVEDELVGPWMQATKPIRRQNLKPTQGQAAHTQSPFAVLASLEENAGGPRRPVNFFRQSSVQGKENVFSANPKVRKRAPGQPSYRVVPQNGQGNQNNNGNSEGTRKAMGKATLGEYFQFASRVHNGGEGKSGSKEGDKGHTGTGVKKGPTQEGTMQQGMVGEQRTHEKESKVCAPHGNETATTQPVPDGAAPQQTSNGLNDMKGRGRPPDVGTSQEGTPHEDVDHKGEPMSMEVEVNPTSMVRIEMDSSKEVDMVDLTN